MDVIKLLLAQTNSEKICFLCFRENANNIISVDDFVEIHDETSSDSTTLRSISNYLFPSYNIITHQCCGNCTTLIIEMYTTVKRGRAKIKIIHLLTEKIYQELESKPVLVRNKMTIKLQGEDKNTEVLLGNQELTKITGNRKTNAALVCDICGKSLKRLSSLKTHIKSHSKTEYVIHKKPTKRNAKYAISKCNVCDYKTGNKQDLKSHMNKSHLNIRPYTCKMCHKGFFSNKNLKEHCLTHERDKTMICDICGGRFSYRKTLEFHIRSHVNDRPFNCVECGHKFVTVSQRNEHIKRKHGPKDFKCDFCDLKYSLKKELKRHVKNIHKL